MRTSKRTSPRKDSPVVLNNSEELISAHRTILEMEKEIEELQEIACGFIKNEEKEHIPENCIVYKFKNGNIKIEKKENKLVISSSSMILFLPISSEELEVSIV